MQKDKNKWPLNHLSWKKRTHSLMKQSISCLGALCTSGAIGIKWCPSQSPLYLQILAMGLSFVFALDVWLMTLVFTIFYGELIIKSLATKICSSWVMERSAHNETSNVWVYHYSIHATSPFFLSRAYMTSLMVACVAIHQPPNGQCVKCIPNAFSSCPHSHIKRLNAED